MKISAALAAVAAVALAPLAAAQPNTCSTQAQTDTLNALQVSHAVKRTTVNGGARVVHTIKVTNTASTAASGLNLFTTPSTDMPLIKGRVAGIHSSPKPTVSYDSQAGTAASTAFTIPAGKTLKATFAYKAINCPAIANPHTLNTWVQLQAGGANCYIAPTAASVRDGCYLPTRHPHRLHHRTESHELNRPPPFPHSQITINKKKSCP